MPRRTLRSATSRIIKPYLSFITPNFQQQEQRKWTSQMLVAGISPKDILTAHVKPILIVELRYNEKVRFRKPTKLIDHQFLHFWTSFDILRNSKFLFGYQCSKSNLVAHFLYTHLGCIRLVQTYSFTDTMYCTYSIVFECLWRTEYGDISLRWPSFSNACVARYRSY